MSFVRPVIRNELACENNPVTGHGRSIRLLTFIRAGIYPAGIVIVPRAGELSNRC
jgi:hypothetical protein